MIEIKSLYHAFGEKIIFEDLNLTFPDKGIVWITGDSGRGKTTLLSIIVGLIKPNHGEIEFSSPNFEISYMFQEPRLLPWANVLENVNLALGGKKSTEKQAADILSRLGLEGELTKYPDELSGGMKQRVSFARALAFQGNALMLDEPFSGLDESKIQLMIDIINKRAKSQLVILVTHQKEFAQSIADKTYAI